MSTPMAWWNTTCTSGSCWTSSTSSASPTTRSFSTARTTGRTTTPGRTPAATPFRGEKNTNWEGGWRVPAMVRWPGKVPAGTVTNEIMAHMDWLPTFLAAAGMPDAKEKLLRGHQADGKRFKVHLDGYNQLDLLLGNGPSGRDELFYFSDDGDLISLRFKDWKIVFMEQRVQRNPASLGRALRYAPRSKALQPASRPLRARGHHFEYLLGLVDRPGVRHLRRADAGRKLLAVFPGVPTEGQSRELHHRRRAREGAFSSHALSPA